MTFTIKGKSETLSAPTLIPAVVVSKSSTPAATTVMSPVVYKSPAKVDDVILGVIGTDKKVTSPVSHISDDDIKYKTVLPGYTHYEDKVVLSSISDFTIKTVNRQHRAFNALGDTAGVTDQRPVILAVTNFEPILIRDIPPSASVKDAPFTRMGKHLLEQFFVRQLISENIQRLVLELRKDPKTSSQLSLLERGFKTGFDRDFKPAQELFSAIQDLEQLKKAFEFKRYETFSSTVIESVMHPERFALAVTRDVTSVRLSDLFTGDLHFNETSFRTFTNTKVLFQLLYELQHFTKNHSYDLIRFDTTNHTQDDSQIATTKNFNVSPKYSIGFFERYKTITITQAKLEELFKASDQDAIVRKVQESFKLVQSELPTNLLDRMSLLSSLISKEFRASSGMSDGDFQKRLKSYGFDASSDTNLIDQLVGDIPDTVTDVLTPQPKGSLSNILQIIDSDAAVLPFEQKYIESENGTYTPGSAYLVDSILNDPTTKFNDLVLQKYLASIATSLSALEDVMNQLRFVNTSKYSASGLDRADVFFVRTLAEVMRASFSNGDLSAGILVGTQNEVLVSTMSLAQTDDTLKSLLFSLFIAEDLDPPPATTAGGLSVFAKAAIDIFFRTDLTNKISERVASLLSASRVSSSTAFSHYKKFDGLSSTVESHGDALTLADGSDSAVKRDIGDEEFRDAFSSDQFKKMRAAFKSITDEFETGQAFDSSRRTRFSRVPAVVMQMLVFELMISLTVRFTSAKFQLGPTGTLQTSNDSVKAANFRILLDKLVVAPDLQKALQIDVADDADKFDPQFRILGRKLNDEETAIKKIYVAVFGAVSGVQKKGNEIVSLFQPGTGKHSKIFDDLAQLISPELVSFLDSAQVRLAVWQTQEIMARATETLKSSDTFRFLDDSVMSPILLFALSALVSEKKFQQDAAENMRLLTVGLPLGFSKHLQERIKLKNVKDHAHVESKQKDIIKVNVYKRDLEFPDIVFQPQTFLFELSRFVSAISSFNDTLISSDPGFGSFDTLLKRVKTIDVGDGGTDFNAPSPGISALSSEEYDFLSTSDKESLIKNHTVSSLLEQYVKLLTGVSLDEQAFLLKGSNDVTPTTLIDESILKQLIDQHVKSVAKLDSFDSSVDKVDDIAMPVETRDHIYHDMKHLSALAFSRTTLSMPVGEIRRALTPKIFERIFNIPVDPDDFVIDITGTNSTEFGTAALEHLISTGQVAVVETPSSALGIMAHDVYKLSERNRKRGTVVLEQYFTTIETVLGTEV